MLPATCSAFFFIGNKTPIHHISSFSFSRIKYQRYSSFDMFSSGAESENEDQNKMHEFFASLDALSPADFLPDSSFSAKLPHSRTDDTQASNFGKSSEEEVEMYLEMQRELVGAPLAGEFTNDSKEEDEFMSEIFGENQADFESIFDDAAKHPWESINPILRLRGPVATGYGRGGKKLGVPTANLPSSLFQSALEDVKAGVYFGWAVIEQATPDSKKVRNKPIKAVVNVGYSPTFEGKENREKIVEAHLITTSSPMTKYEGVEGIDEIIDDSAQEIEIDEDFYGETMRLQLLGFLRTEQKFDSFPELIAQIHCDIGHAAWALGSFPFVLSREDEFISNHETGSAWIGSGGGDGSASWEFEAW